MLGIEAHAVGNEVRSGKDGRQQQQPASDALPNARPRSHRMTEPLRIVAWAARDMIRLVRERDDGTSQRQEQPVIGGAGAGTYRRGAQRVAQARLAGLKQEFSAGDRHSYLST